MDFNLSHINENIVLNNKKYILYEFLCIVLKYMNIYNIYNSGKEFTISIEFITYNKLQIIFFDKGSNSNIEYYKRCIVDDIEEQGLNNYIQIENEIAITGLYSYSTFAYIERYFGIKNSNNNRWAMCERISLRLSKEVRDLLSDCKALLFL